MRFTIFILLLSITTSSCISKSRVTSDTAPSHQLWSGLLKKYVTSEGLVNYGELVNERSTLEKYLELLSNNAPDVEKWTYEEQLAYWINAYNALTVKLIIDNYPVNSIKDLHPLNIPFVSSVWQKKFFKIGGEKMNLDHIEHKILRKQFNEPRIHFAINCASLSCPILLDEAFDPKRLEEQLEQQTVTFINDPNRNTITSQDLKLSKIFSWFKGDFTKNKSLIDFINQYSKIVVDRGVDVKYLDYNWKLNEGK
ncbi:MAG: DUF547 domain-containing protein [Bacteroidota bacterium]